MIETALIFDRQGKVLRFFEPEGRSSAYIPDVQSQGDILWSERTAEILYYYVKENADIIGGIAHTHPWWGAAAPSGIDLGTFLVLDSLVPGRNLLWPVVTFSDMKVYMKVDGTTDYKELPEEGWLKFEGIDELRVRSGLRDTPPAE